jgi:hypothetical protein
MISIDLLFKKKNLLLSRYLLFLQTYVCTLSNNDHERMFTSLYEEKINYFLLFLVDDILTWKDPKISGAILTLITVSLISFSTFSLLSIIGFVLLTGMSLVGGYRLYLTIMNKVKGQSDDTFK